MLDAVDRQDPSDIPAALEPYLDRRQLALLRIVQDREPEAVRLLPGGVLLSDGGHCRV